MVCCNSRLLFCLKPVSKVDSNPTLAIARSLSIATWSKPCLGTLKCAKSSTIPTSAVGCAGSQRAASCHTAPRLYLTCFGSALGWFLKFKDGINGSYHVPPCTGEKCSLFYHDQDQTPEHPKGDGSCVDDCRPPPLRTCKHAMNVCLPASIGDCGDSPCGEYLWDHRNASLREWLVTDFVSNPTTGIGNPNVDGFYLDDGWSNTSEAPASWWPKEGFCSADVIGGPTEE